MLATQAGVADRERPPLRGGTARPRTSAGVWSCSRIASGSRRSSTTASSSRCSRWGWGCRARPRSRTTPRSPPAWRTPSKTSIARSADLRNYIFGLRPGILADRQLDEAIRELCAEFEERTGVVTVAVVEPVAAAELASRASDVIQLVREALSNVGRHAEATTTRVSLIRPPDGALVLEIDDDGRGFDGSARSRGMGLANLEARVRGMGGELATVSSARRRDDRDRAMAGLTAGHRFVRSASPMPTGRSTPSPSRTCRSDPRRGSGCGSGTPRSPGCRRGRAGRTAIPARSRACRPCTGSTA